jgi:hypothetical protein
MITGLSFARTSITAVAALGLATALLVSGAGVAPASALSTTNVTDLTPKASLSAGDEITPEMLDQTYSELLGSDVPRTVEGEGEAALTTFHLADGFSLTFGVGSAPAASDAITPYIGGGSDRRGMYVLLNQFDQNLVISGSGFALGAAICAIPAVGTVACVVIGAILTVATTVLASNGGTCKNNRQLKIYVTNGIRSGGCV